MKFCLTDRRLYYSFPTSQKGTGNGFSLVEVLSVIFLSTLLLSIGLAGFSRSALRDPLSQATDKVQFLLSQARAEAIAKNEMCALILYDDPASEDHFRRRLTLASFQNKEGDSIDPLHDALLLQRKWVTLPEHVMIDVGFSNQIEPNAFSTSPQGGQVMALGRSAVSAGSVSEKHPLVRGILFDRFGAVVSYQNGQWVQYVNHTPAVTQKGCYVVLRDSQQRGTPYAGGHGQEDLAHVRRLYLSPLTGKVQKL